LSTFAFNIQPAKAVSGEIIINPNGTISSPVTANITVSNNETYTFNSNNYLPIVVNRSNIIINGNGYAINGPGISGGNGGISLTYESNVTIENVKITAFFYGVIISNSPRCTVSGNNLTANEDGVDVVSSSSYCNVSANTFQNDGLFVEYSFHNVVMNNKVNGEPLYYLEGVRQSTTVPSGVGEVVLVNCSNIIVSNQSLSNASDGVELYQTNSTRITNNKMTNNGLGIYIGASFSNSISGNNLTNNGNGILLLYSSSNSLSGNNLTGNGNNGIQLTYALDNVLSGNDVTGSSHGIYLYHSSGNTFYHNNFVGNYQQVESDGSPNTWDNGYPSGGNYWSDYQTKYPSAAEIDSSGIWNTPYVIDTNNTDHYPLMNQVTVPEFQPYMLLPLFVTVTLIGALILRRKRRDLYASA
jgi:parallel beta-helix repeat protein